MSDNGPQSGTQSMETALAAISSSMAEAQVALDGYLRSREEVKALQAQLADANARLAAHRNAAHTALSALSTLQSSAFGPRTDGAGGDAGMALTQQAVLEDGPPPTPAAGTAAAVGTMLGAAGVAEAVQADPAPPATAEPEPAALGTTPAEPVASEQPVLEAQAPQTLTEAPAETAPETASEMASETAPETDPEPAPAMGPVDMSPGADTSPVAAGPASPDEPAAEAPAPRPPFSWGLSAPAPQPPAPTQAEQAPQPPVEPPPPLTANDPPPASPGWSPRF
jgi:hypothetical protein